MLVVLTLGLGVRFFKKVETEVFSSGRFGGFGQQDTGIEVEKQRNLSLSEGLLVKSNFGHKLG